MRISDWSSDVCSSDLPTYDFESPAPVSGGLVTTGSSNGIRAQPFGSAGNYWAVGPSDGSPGVMDLASIGDIFNVSFLWGSVDAYNTIEFLGAGDRKSTRLNSSH